MLFVEDDTLDGQTQKMRSPRWSLGRLALR